jgi:hypothetical protein
MGPHLEYVFFLMFPFLLQIKVDTDSYIHARLYVVPWEHRKEVPSVQINKDQDDPIEYF